MNRFHLVFVFGLMCIAPRAPANGQPPCPVANDAPFIVTILALDKDRVTLTWPGCADQVYIVYAADSLETNTAWTPVTWMRGEDGSTSWTDAHTAEVTERFYKVGQLPQAGDEDGDGMPNGFETDNNLNPLDPSDATHDADGDGVDNLTEYLQGRDPTKGAVADSSGLVNLNVFTPLE